jgi:hypothetical protein
MPVAAFIMLALRLHWMVFSIPFDGQFPGYAAGYVERTNPPARINGVAKESAPGWG